MGFDQLAWLFMYNGESLRARVCARVCARASCLAFVRGACMAHVVPAGAHAMLTPGLCGCYMYIAGHGSRMLSCFGYTIRGLHLRL